MLDQDNDRDLLIMETIDQNGYDHVSNDKDKRSAGIGSQALKLLIERYPDAQIVTEFETPDDSCDNNAFRLRRCVVCLALV